MDEAPAELTPEQIEIGRSNDLMQNDELKSRIGKSFGVDKHSEMKRYQSQLERLGEWAQMKGAKDQEDAIWQIRQLANRVGGPSFGTHIIQHLATYAYLEMERMKIDDQLKKYGR